MVDLNESQDPDEELLQRLLKKLISRIKLSVIISSAVAVGSFLVTVTFFFAVYQSKIDRLEKDVEEHKLQLEKMSDTIDKVEASAIEASTLLNVIVYGQKSQPSLPKGKKDVKGQ